MSVQPGNHVSECRQISLDHLIDVWSLHLHCYGFTRRQRAAMHLSQRSRCQGNGIKRLIEIFEWTSKVMFQNGSDVLEGYGWDFVLQEGKFLDVFCGKQIDA